MHANLAHLSEFIRKSHLKLKKKIKMSLIMIKM